MPKSMHCAGNIATLLFFKRKKHLIMISSPRLLHHRLIRKIHRRSNNEDRAKVMHPSVKPAGTARAQSTLNHYYIESSSSSSHSPLIAILRPNDRERSTHPKCFMAFWCWPLSINYLILTTLTPYNGGQGTFSFMHCSLWEDWDENIF